MRYPNIDAERARRGMTVADLAAALGVGRKTLYNWCRRGRIPTKKLEAMANIFQCPSDYLLENGEEVQHA